MRELNKRMFSDYFCVNSMERVRESGRVCNGVTKLLLARSYPKA